MLARTETRNAGSAKPTGRPAERLYDARSGSERRSDRNEGDFVIPDFEPPRLITGPYGHSERAPQPRR
jgi:hypothetical protein